MKEFGNKDSEREIARLRKQSGAKSPVKTNVLKFEGKSPATSPVKKNVLKFEGKNDKSDIPSPESRNARREQRNARLQNQALSPTRSKSPGMKNERPNQLFSPTRSKSPGMSSEQPNQFLSPTRGKSPGSSNSRQNEFSSPTRSKSPGIVTERITKSYSPSPTKSPGEHSKWTRSDNSSWKKESPDSSTKMTEIVPSEPLPKSDDVDISWILDNIEFVATPEDRGMLNASAPNEKENEEAEDEENQEGDENGGEEKLVEEKERFRNVLNYNMAAWDKSDSPEDMPKKADEFIQRLCDQVRNHVEYMCGVNFITYQAISYKVRVAGAEGIYYYVKVNVWQNYCIHLRIFSHKNELKATPTLQAILERAQSDKGNIEFF